MRTAQAVQPSSVKLIPGGCRIIVRPDSEGYDESAFGEDGPKVVKKGDGYFTESGIEIPKTVEDKVKRRALTGTIAACGPVMEMEFLDNDTNELRRLKAGDRVLFGEYAGTQLERAIPGWEQMVLMSEDDVLAVLEGM